jgi:hypothetical protein
MNPESDYVYDVFVSYTRDHPVGTWVKDRFLKDFVGYLGDALGRRARVFFDQDEIESGEDQVEKLRWGLKVSRVLVAICSARYFGDSDYCRMEWRTFGKRDLEGNKVHRPRVPVRYSDGESFPREARRTQQADFSNANHICESFYKNDVRAIAYEDNVKKLAKAVVKAIGRAPKYSPNFPIAELVKTPPRPMKQPRL